MQLIDLIERSKVVFGKVGATYNGAEAKWTFPNGAILLFRHLDRDTDADKYQGHNYTRVYIDEAGTFPSYAPIQKLKGTLRSAHGVFCKMILTGNPGGPGHVWLKERFITVGPPFEPIEEIFVNPFSKKEITLKRVFIPSRVTENPYLDDMYVARLQQVGSERLVEAWLQGNWDIIEGAFFDRWSAKNVVRPFLIPKGWTRFRSIDWGYSRPFSVQWWAVASDDVIHDGRIIPRGAIIQYREFYGVKRNPKHGMPVSSWPVEPNVGLRMTPRQVSEQIRKMEGNEEIAYSVLDPACYATQNGGKTIAEEMAEAGVQCRPATNTRVGKLGAVSGWALVRARIDGDGDLEGLPMLYVFETCTQFLRTFPVLQHDPDRPEDVMTDMEDHAGDACRYACASRPWAADGKLPERPKELVFEAKDGGYTITANQTMREILDSMSKPKGLR